MAKISSHRPLGLVKYKVGIFLLPLLAPILLFAQIDPEGAILRAYALDEQGKMDHAIALLRPLINSGAFHGAELGEHGSSWAWPTQTRMSFTTRATRTNRPSLFCSPCRKVSGTMPR
jgi:hypothetical protein